jgi:hypothetical protein
MNIRAAGSGKGPWRRGAVLQIVLALITAAVIGTLAISSANTNTVTGTTVKRKKDPPPMANVELDVALRRVHLGPQELAAIGLSAQQTTALVGRARSGLSGSIVAFRAADDAAANARKELDRLERLVRSGLGTENDVSALTTAQSTLASTTATRQQQLDAVLAAGVGDALSPDQMATLATVRTNSVWDIPLEYRCRSGQVLERDWVALRDALADQRIAARQGGSPSQGSQSVLDAWGQDTAVSGAHTNLANGLETVTAAYNSAISGPP